MSNLEKYFDDKQQAGCLPRLVRPSAGPHRWPEDVKRLQTALQNIGYDASTEDVAAAYEDYSENEMCAGWLTLSIWTNDESAARCLVEKGYLVRPNVQALAPSPTQESTNE